MFVELNTPRSHVFSGYADGAELLTTDGKITIQSAEESYLNLTETTQITLRVGTEFITFVLKNAAASVRGRRLTVLAEEIRQLDEPEAIAEPAS